MLNFDYLKELSQTELPALSELYRLCDLAETRQYTEPDSSAINARKAPEATSFGYNELKDTPYRGSRNYWYLFNKEGRKPLSDTNRGGYVLKLWENEYAKYKGDNPLECYSLDENLNRAPILTITDSDAPVQLVKDGVVIKENRVKYFFSEKEFQYFGLLYIPTPLSKFLEIHNLAK